MPSDVVGARVVIRSAERFSETLLSESETEAGE